GLLVVRDLGSVAGAQLTGVPLPRTLADRAAQAEAAQVELVPTQEDLAVLLGSSLCKADVARRLRLAHAVVAQRFEPQAARRRLTYFDEVLADTQRTVGRVLQVLLDLPPLLRKLRNTIRRRIVGNRTIGGLNHARHCSILLVVKWEAPAWDER